LIPQYDVHAAAFNPRSFKPSSFNPRPATETMKFLFDLLPVFAFFAAYMVAERMPAQAAALASGILGGLGGQVIASQAPILLATLVAIIATFAQVGYLLARKRKVDRMLWISLAIIVVMGGATLLLRDDRFIKWKPTVLYWAFALVLLGSDLVFRKNLIRNMMQEQMVLPEAVWRRLNLSWAGFFILMGVVNLYVAFWPCFSHAPCTPYFTQDQWVKFKLFGSMGLMLVFIVAQAFMLSRFLEQQERK
jgi:intracellular septation protein